MIDQQFSQEFRDLNHVPRWSIIRKTRQQSVTEHSYFVMVYGLAIAKAINYRGSMSILIRELMTHDWDEMITGDINSPVKRLMERKNDPKAMENYEKSIQMELQKKVGFPSGLQYTNLPVHDVTTDYEDEHKQVKKIRRVADWYESLLYLSEEYAMGNISVKEAMELVLGKLQDSLSALAHNLPSHTHAKSVETIGSLMKEEYMAAKLGNYHLVKDDALGKI